MRKRRSNKAPTPPPITAIVKGRERTLKADEIEMLKQTVAKGASDEEFKLFMLICRKHRLDPFTKQVYCVIWPTENGRSHEMVIITGINGYRMMAARDHKNFAGTSKPEFTWPSPAEKTPKGRRIPETATVHAYVTGEVSPKGSATVYWEEFAPADLTAKRSDFWNRMPKHMLAKCAEAHALRKAFPDLSDIFTEEEISQSAEQVTPGGRRISRGSAAPESRQLPTAVNQLTPQEVAAAKTRGDWCETHHCLAIHCPADEHTAAENESIWNKMQTRADGKTIDVTPTNSGKPEARPETKAASKEPPLKKLPAGCTLLRGTIHRVIYAQSKEKKVPYINIRIGQEWHTCWSTTIAKFFPSEAAVVAQLIEAWINPQKQIVGLQRLGRMYFQPDGRTPILRQPGEEG
jgi:phage recombination protein Bet